MLKNTITEFIHPCFGKIRMNEKFSKILELEPFRELAYKSQLGTIILSINCLNAKHTRLLHSIGVYYLTSLLVQTCKDKFSNYLDISLQDEETLQLAALGHDIGHLPFSHSLEIEGAKSHEERTIELFEEYQDQINEIFGYDIVSRVISIFKMNMTIKEKGSDGQTYEELDILFIFSSLLVGTIDCDRMEYIITDRYMLTGEKLDFRSIFDYITIVLLNNAPTVGFEKEAVSIIENLLITRFMQYEEFYFLEEATLTEIVLQEYFLTSSCNSDKLTSYTEYGILSELRSVLVDSNDAVSRRFAEILVLGNRENILFKKFTSKEEFDLFMIKLYSIARKDNNYGNLWVKTAHKTNCIYNPNKNKVYIKDDDGVVKDITDVSMKITNFSVDYYYVMVDLSPIYGTDVTVAKNLKSLFNDNAVEIEKKFIPKYNITNTAYVDDTFNFISTIPGVTFLDKVKKVINFDQYYTPCVAVPKGMSMRLRTTLSEKCYYIKFPADDGTCITKRDEHSFPNCSSLNEFIEIAENLIAFKGYHLKNELILTDGVNITTERSKVLATVFDSIVEIAFDISTYEYNGNIKKDKMLECELKHGDDLALWYLAKYLKNATFLETNESKEIRAKKALNLNL